MVVDFDFDVNLNLLRDIMLGLMCLKWLNVMAVGFIKELYQLSKKCL